MIQDLPELLSLKETSRILGVHKNTLRQWDQKGILKAVRYGERQDRHFKKADILQLMRRRQKCKKSDEDKRENSSLKVLLERLSRLQKITEALVKAASINDIATISVNDGTKALEAESGAIFLVSLKKNYIELFASVGYHPKIVKKLKRISLKKVIPTTDAVLKGKPILIETYAECMLRYPDSQEQSFAGISKAFAAIPIILHNKVIGVLSYSFSENTHFSRNEVIFMQTIANQFSNAFARERIS
ncbi:MAG: GAF domain-containing protein [Candidatus Levyibacteriota bacterium]